MLMDNREMIVRCGLKEELEQLHSCQRDALAMRAIPLSVIASVCANYGLAQSPLVKKRFPFVVVAGVMGYLYGIWSYHKKCEEKFAYIQDLYAIEPTQQPQYTNEWSTDRLVDAILEMPPFTGSN